MTKSAGNTIAAEPAIEPGPRLGRSDPLLQDLWAVKAAMNAESGSPVETFEESSAAGTLARLQSPEFRALPKADWADFKQHITQLRDGWCDN